MTINDTKHFGFVSVLGLPNAGKSTLVNAMVGAKVSIVSKKVQTTRCRVLGIAMHGEAQIVLMDTPGIFAPDKTLERAMVGAAWETIDMADIIIHLIDVSNTRATTQNKIILDKLPAGTPVILVLNKTDKISKPELLTLTMEMNKLHHYAATFMISALHNDGVKDVMNYLAQNVPQQDWQFDPEQTTDLPMRFMAAEMTREQVFHQLHEELPYATLVETESWETFDNGSIKIDQIIYVQRDTQKAIVLGKGGSRIKEIGAAARAEMEQVFGLKIHLKLFVKVQSDWTERQDNLRLMGLAQ